MKGFAFSLSAIYALTIVFIAISAAAIFSSYTSPFWKIDNLRTLGRDYLKLNAENISVSPSQFHTLTGFTISNTSVGGPLVVRAELYYYPLLCNCSSSCTLNKTAADNCLNSQEIKNKYHFEGWVH